MKKIMMHVVCSQHDELAVLFKGWKKIMRRCSATNQLRAGLRRWTAQKLLTQQYASWLVDEREGRSAHPEGLKAWVRFPRVALGLMDFASSCNSGFRFGVHGVYEYPSYFQCALVFEELYEVMLNAIALAQKAGSTPCVGGVLMSPCGRTHSSLITRSSRNPSRKKHNIFSGLWAPESSFDEQLGSTMNYHRPPRAIRLHPP